MPTAYTGSAVATEAPSPPPGPGVAPIVNIPIDGESLNAASVAQGFKTLADFAAYANKSTTAIRVFDEFTGSALNLGIWQDDTNVSMISDATNGGAGAAQCFSDLIDMDIATCELALSTSGIYFFAKVSVASFDTAATITIGVDSVTAGNVIKFQAIQTSSATFWYTKIGAAAAVITAVPVVHGYRTFEISRVGTAVTFKIDGVSVATGTSSTNITDGVFRSKSTSNTTDTCRITVDRQLGIGGIT